MSTATGYGLDVAERDAASTDELDALEAHWRAANFPRAAQVYLRENVPLEEPLRPEHIKPRLLGRWGTVPGFNFVYPHLDRLIRAEDSDALLIAGWSWLVEEV
jgi:xylulose-5-phosphate/fructose-6-phosphate phosphoketolase